MEKVFYCKECGAELIYTVEPDEKSSGTILGEGLFRCPVCDNWYCGEWNGKETVPDYDD